MMLAVAMLAWARAAGGYPVGPPVGMDQLTAQADIIFKGVATESVPVEDAWFKPCSGFIAWETRFTVISVIKGESPGSTLRFRHYDVSPLPQGRMYQPQYYHFQTNRAHIVFAKKTEVSSVYRQIWSNHKGKEDQGVLLCLDDRPLTATNAREAFWGELVAMLGSTDAGNVTYAIPQLDQMSGGRSEYDATRDFDRTNVLEAVHGLMASADPKIAQAAILLVGSHNPYMSDAQAEFWLATVGSAEIPGLGKMDPGMQNIGGRLYWRELANTADGTASAGTRALAIRALGLLRLPALREPVNRWLVDREAAVRASATVLLADFPAADTAQQLTFLAGDPAPTVRTSVARAIGFSQQNALVDLLGVLLSDEDRDVRRAASTSLLSFSPKDEAVARVLQVNRGKAEFHPLFLNALARERPEPYLDDLARVVAENTQPENWRGGEIPAFTAWKILFKYVKSQPPEVLSSGNVDRYLDAVEKVGNYSSSNQRDIYAFYIGRGMAARAKAFREQANEAATYDLDHYFRQVDENPSHYLQE